MEAFSFSVNGSISSSPKISTIVVRKPSTVVTLKSSSSTATAHAFHAFNSPMLNTSKEDISAASNSQDTTSTDETKNDESE